MAAALVALSGARAAQAAQARLEAEVRPDLQTITGTLTLTDGAGLRLVDALAALPVPDDDVLRRRTFPGAVESGWVHWSEVSEGRWTFYAVLPRRYDASGKVPGHGLFANGLWHTMFMRGATAEPVTWDAVVALPPGTTGVLNRAVSERVVRWSGVAERLSLAVVPDARVIDLDLPVGRVVLVDHGPARPRRDELLTTVVREQWPGPGAPDLVIVETPSRRRLTRDGPGLLFLSDRAFRVTGPLAAFHSAAVRRGVFAAGLPIASAWERDLAAAGLSDAASARDPDLRTQLGWLSWIPQVDELLYSGRLPFYGDVFDETWPADPVRDDALEVLDPRAPGAAVMRRLDLRYGDGTAERLAWALAQGVALPDAAAQVGVPIGELLVWRRAPPPEDLSLTVTQDETGWTLAVERPGAAQSPPEPIEIAVDGERMIWDATADDHELRAPLPGRPDSIVVDPDGLVDDPDRSDLRWPVRWTAIAYLWWSDFSLRGGGLDAGGNLVFRKQYATRNRFGLTAAVSPQDTVSAAATWYHHFGPLFDRRRRPFRLWAGGGPAVLKPGYRATADGRLALDLYAGLAWDTVVDPIFPRQGHRVSLSGSGGQVLGTEANWAAIQSTAGGVVGLGQRLALAGRVRAGWATGDVAHRLLTLGGGAGVQGLAPNTVVGRQLALGRTELRWQPVRFASVPLWLAWLSDVQVHGGIEAGTLGDAFDAPVPGATAVGWTGGGALTFDVLGARPTLLGVWLAAPLWTSHPSLDVELPMQVYLRMFQAL